MSDFDSNALAEWRAAIGTRETRHERLEHESARRYALALGVDSEVERVLPPLAHWAFFLPQPGDGEIGTDGHPRRGGFLPPISLARRMFAAAQLSFEEPLLLGGDAELTSTIADVTHKTGKTGDLVFVEVDRVLSQEGTVRVRERQSYVYRPAGAPIPLPVANAEPIEGELWQPGPVNLFRFSAVTFNGHRIHYDLPYAKSEEGYPALVVHGPFAAARLAALAERRGALRQFSFRAQQPLFLGQPIRLQSKADEVRAVRCDGAIAMTAKVAYR
jgi:3-methylfumaryl-CoA hydratase